MKKHIFILLIITLSTSFFYAQVTESLPEESTEIKPKFAKNTFLSTSIINMHSTEIINKSNMQFQVAHHFGLTWNKDANTGQNLAQVLGFNSGVAKTYVSLDYTLIDNANLGVAMAGDLKFEGWVKLRLIRQQSGPKNVPVSMTWLSLANADALEDPSNDDNPEYVSWNKFVYLHQLIVARKFNPKFSLQIIPSIIHYNVVPYGINNTNNIFSIGLGGKYQLKQNFGLTFEYSRQLNMYKDVLDDAGAISNFAPDLVSAGVEINTGGHVFQLFISNTTAASLVEQLSRNQNFIKDGKFAIGFRLNRSFYLGKE